MYINEITIGSQVTIKVKVEGQILEFNSEVVATGDTRKGKFLACNFIIIQDKVLNLSRHHVFVDIHNIGDGRDYRFFLNASALDKKNRNMRLYSTDNAKAKNHREAFRVPCGYRAVLQIGNNRKAIDGHVHDLSFTGASYVFTTDAANVTVGDSVSGSIYDNDEHLYRTSGEIVRILENFGKDLTLIGVKFEGDIKIQGLIGKLQLNELRVRGEERHKQERLRRYINE